MTHTQRILDMITAATPTGGATFAEIARATGVSWQTANGRARSLREGDTIIRAGAGRWIVNPAPVAKPGRRHRSGARPRTSAKPEPRILLERDTPREVLHYADVVRREHQCPVVPLQGGKVLVDTIEVPVAELARLALGQVRLRELRG